MTLSFHSQICHTSLSPSDFPKQTTGWLCNQAASLVVTSLSSEQPRNVECERSRRDHGGITSPIGLAILPMSARRPLTSPAFSISSGIIQPVMSYYGGRWCQRLMISSALFPDLYVYLHTSIAKWCRDGNANIWTFQLETKLRRLNSPIKIECPKVTIISMRDVRYTVC